MSRGQSMDGNIVRSGEGVYEPLGRFESWVSLRVGIRQALLSESVRGTCEWVRRDGGRNGKVEEEKRDLLKGRSQTEDWNNRR